MRLASAIVLVALLAPTSVATPVVDTGPAVFTYQFLEQPIQNMVPDSVSVAYAAGKVGAVWEENDISTGYSRVTLHMSVTDGVNAFSFQRPDGSALAVSAIFDERGRFHVMDFYHPSDSSYTDVLVTTFDGSSWSTRAIDRVGWGYQSHAVEHNGAPYFGAEVNPNSTAASITSFRVYTLDAETDQWKILTTQPDFGRFPAFDIDHEGRIHLIFNPRYGDWHDHYMVYDNGTWSASTLAPYSQDQWGDHSIAIGPDDKPYFAYTDGERRPHTYTPDTSGQYHDSIVYGGVGHQIQLKVDERRNLHVMTWQFNADFNTPTTDQYYYSRYDPISGWTHESIFGGSYQSRATMVLDDGGDPVIGVPNTAMETVVGVPGVRDTGSVLIARPISRFAHETSALPAVDLA